MSPEVKLVLGQEAHQTVTGRQSVVFSSILVFLGVFVVVSIVGCDRDVIVAIELVVAIEIGIGIHMVHNLSVRGLVLISSLNSSSPPLFIYHELAVKLEKKRG